MTGAVAGRREQRHVAVAEVDRRAVGHRLGRVERLAEPGDGAGVHLLGERHVVERGEPRVALADRALGVAHQRDVVGAGHDPGAGIGGEHLGRARHVVAVGMREQHDRRHAEPRQHRQDAVSRESPAGRCRPPAPRARRRSRPGG